MTGRATSPFQTTIRAFGIDLQGGKGNASYFPDVAPTCMAISHGTPNAAMLYAPRGVQPFPRRPPRLASPNHRRQLP